MRSLCRVKYDLHHPPVTDQNLPYRSGPPLIKGNTAYEIDATLAPSCLYVLEIGRSIQGYLEAVSLVLPCNGIDDCRSIRSIDQSIFNVDCGCLATLFQAEPCHWRNKNIPHLC